jgi:hypothetical protein
MAAKKGRSSGTNAPGSTKTGGWKEFLEGFPWFEGPDRYPLPAYSEFMPAPRLGISPLGEVDPDVLQEQDLAGWSISEAEEQWELRPGTEQIARQIMSHLVRFGKGERDSSIAEHGNSNLINNPYWPPELAERAGQLAQERFVSILQLSLSRTQDDKGRLLWTFFGGSELDPELLFWNRDPDPSDVQPDPQLTLLIHLIQEAYGEQVSTAAGLCSCGFRILPGSLDIPGLSPEKFHFPKWAGPLLIEEDFPVNRLHYLLTFRPFTRIPQPYQDRYLSGQLVLLPFPGSLIFWGMQSYRKLQRVLPHAMQIPLLRLVPRQGKREGIRVPQSGWLHVTRPNLNLGEVHNEIILDTYARTHRWDRRQRYEDELSNNPRLERIAKVLFSTDLDTIGLYDKPMARNCQLWDHQHELVLDGPNSGYESIHTAEARLLAGGLFGYRFLFPASRVGRYEIFWHYPVIAYQTATGETRLLSDPPPGFLRAYSLDPERPNLHFDLWPRIADRFVYRSALQDFHNPHDHYTRQTSFNILSLLDSWHLLGEKPLPRSFAQQLVRIAKDESLEDWLAALPERCTQPEQGQAMQIELRRFLEDPAGPVVVPEPITFSATANRVFEEAYWKDIHMLSAGEFHNQDNADCVQDPITEQESAYHQRDLERLGEALIGRHQQAIDAAGMNGQAWVGDLPFPWKTDFDFPLFEGWKNDQKRKTEERDILVIIPGKNHHQAVVLADHYDTAYMEDLYDRSRGGSGARLSAAGADDNHSATAVLLQAAPIYLQLASQGALARDIWLLHLTGEEFPSDCMGARHFCQALIQKTLKQRLPGGRWRNLSATQVQGVFLMDMIAHNREVGRNIFQISPGRGRRSLELAVQAHLANLAWNAGTTRWNRLPERQGCGQGRRSTDGSQIPEKAAHLALSGEIRTQDDPASSLYNTDGQIFSDSGVPVVLFMENYDINRTGYHDTRDTMENIDLDYGSALAAIAIESCARVAMAEGGS